MSGEPWGSLITFRGNSIFTPDAEKQLRETTQYRQKKGMIAIAVVILIAPMRICNKCNYSVFITTTK